MRVSAGAACRVTGSGRSVLEVFQIRRTITLKALFGFMGAIILSCIPLCTLAQGTGGSVMQGAGSAAGGAAAGAAQQAGQNAAGQAMQNIGLASPSPAASPAAANPAAMASPAAAASAAQMPGAVPSVPQ